mgnify:FL=1
MKNEDHVFIRDLELLCSIGIHDHEKQAPQRVLINIDMMAYPSSVDVNDDHENVICYETVTNQIRALIAKGHVNLVETLAEDIASLCLKNTRVFNVRVRIEKPDIIADTRSVGVEIVRGNDGV